VSGSSTGAVSILGGMGGEAGRRDEEQNRSPQEGHSCSSGLRALVCACQPGCARGPAAMCACHHAPRDNARSNVNVRGLGLGLP
jgi:hypothetical protein